MLAEEEWMEIPKFMGFLPIMPTFVGLSSQVCLVDIMAICIRGFGQF